MNTKILFPILIFASLFIDSTLISLPIFFALSISYYILFPSSITLLILLIAGTLFDILKVSPVGTTPIVMGGVFLIIYFWRLQAELKDYRMTIGIIFIFTLLYARFFNYSNNPLIYILIFATTALLFSYFGKKHPRLFLR